MDGHLQLVVERVWSVALVWEFNEVDVVLCRGFFSLLLCLLSHQGGFVDREVFFWGGYVDLEVFFCFCLLPKLLLSSLDQVQHARARVLALLDRHNDEAHAREGFVVWVLKVRFITAFIFFITAL